MAKTILITANWHTGAQDYVLSWDIVHFGDVELVDGDVNRYYCQIQQVTGLAHK